MGDKLKFTKYIIFVSALVFSHLASSQTWSWKYISYVSGARGFEGSVDLTWKSDNFFLKFMVPNMNRCWQGELDAAPIVQGNILYISINNAVGNCQKARLAIYLDGSGGEREFFSNNEWKKEDVDRGLSSLSPKDLSSLYQILKINNAKGNKGNSSQDIPANQSASTPSQETGSPNFSESANKKAITAVPMPSPIPATTTAPARVAAIANVDVPKQTSLPQGASSQSLQVTTNPIDQAKKTSGNEVWISFNPSISVQERQFCRIVENFRTENLLALQSNNKIKVNETYRNLVQSLNSLLPDGKFQGWVMRTVAVDQASDGSAEVLLELPCNIYVGSNACDANPKNYYGTAPEGSRIYTELAKMTVGDFALTSGQFVYTDDKAFDKSRSVASFKFMRTGAHCKAKEISTDAEFFGTKLDVISTIK